GRHALDQRPLPVLIEMALLVRVRDAVAEDLVATLAQALGNVRRHLVDGGVHLGLGRQAELVEQLEQPPNADAVAVVAPAVDALPLRRVGWRDGGALAGTEAEGFDVERHVDGQRAAAGPGVVGSLRDVRVLVASVRRQHRVRPPAVMGARIVHCGAGYAPAWLPRCRLSRGWAPPGEARF